MWIELLNLIIGIAFGYFHRGKEDYTRIIKNGAIAGIFVSIFLALLTMFIAPGAMSINLGVLGMSGIFLEVIIFVIIFILGTFIGDQIEKIRKK
jgi:hypothetical protein